MKVFDLTKAVMPITTFKGHNHHIHSDTLDIMALNFIDMANSMYNMGYSRHAEALINIAEDLNDESEFLRSIPRCIYNKV